MNKFLYAGVLITPTLFSCDQNKENSKPLNIVYIMTDDHSYQTLSAYGHPLSKLAPTPNLDRIAEKGVLFTKAFVENSLSTPSRACLMTGLYSHQNGQKQLGAGIDTTKIFFSELLQEAGYQTGVYGKWHMLCEPKGFDKYKVLWDQGDYYNPEFRSESSDGKYIREEGYATTLITTHAIDFLQGRDKDKPFCLLVHHKAPHRNWMPDTQYLDLYNEIEFPYPETFYDDYSTRCDPARTQAMTIEDEMRLIYDLKLDELKNISPYDKEWNIQEWNSYIERMTDEQREAWFTSYNAQNKSFLENIPQGDELLKWKYQRYIKDYLRCIKSIDDEVGRLLDYLEKEDLMDNTVIVYTSDQGFYMGEHGWFDKRFMYEESFRTPLIIYHPDNKEGKVCDELVQNIDFAPTFLNVAGIEKPDYMVGASLIPFLTNQDVKEWREYLYYHYYDYPAVHYVRRHDGVRDNRYKLIHFYGEENKRDKAINCNEFYDLEKDPHELNNVYDNPDYMEHIQRLQKQLDKFRIDLKVAEF